MRILVSGIMASICLSLVARVANGLATQLAALALKLASSVQDLGEATVPPVLKKAETAVEKRNLPVAAEQPEVGEDDVVRVSTSLITVPAQVMDRNGRYIGGLRREDFVVYENGVEQKLSYFGSIEQPFTVALLLDVSGSTQTRLQAIRAAANAFINRLRPNDQILLVSFHGKTNILTEPVKVSNLPGRKLRRDPSNDVTGLYDTGDVVLNQRLAAITGRKAIVLLTDGVDQGSRRSSRKQNLRDADESDVLIYTVQYNTLPQLPERLSHISDEKVRARLRLRMEREYEVGAAYLRTLADETGGRLYNADSLTYIKQS